MCECMDGGVDGLIDGWVDGWETSGVYVCSWVWVWECESMIDDEEEMSYWMQGDL